MLKLVQMFVVVYLHTDVTIVVLARMKIWKVKNQNYRRRPKGCQGRKVPYGRMENGAIEAIFKYIVEPVMIS